MTKLLTHLTYQMIIQLKTLMDKFDSPSVQGLLETTKFQIVSKNNFVTI